MLTELMSDLIFCCCCPWAVCVCRQWFCNMQDGLLRGKQQHHEKKRLSQAHAMLDPKESKFDKSSSLVVFRPLLFFFGEAAQGQRVIDHQRSTSRTIIATGMRSLENDTWLGVG